MLILTTYLPIQRHRFFLGRFENLHRVVRHRRFLARSVSGYDVISDHCLVGVDGEMFHNDLLPTPTSMLVV